MFPIQWLNQTNVPKKSIEIEKIYEWLFTHDTQSQENVRIFLKMLKLFINSNIVNKRTLLLTIIYFNWYLSFFHLFPVGSNKMSVIVQIVNDKINDWSTGVGKISNLFFFFFGKSEFTKKCLLDSTVDSWFLMKSPVQIFSIVAVWMLFVLKIGPSMMANRKPFNLKKILVAYNAFQVLFSAFICYTVGSLYL